MSTSTPEKTQRKNENLDAFSINRAVENAYRYNTCHIFYDNKTKDWVVKNVRQAIGKKTFKTQAAAIGYAEKIMKRHNCDIVIHNRAGKIRKSARHGI